MSGKFHAPKPSGELNAFEAALKQKTPSAILANNPSMRRAKSGPKAPTFAMQIKVIGQRTARPNAPAQRGHISTANSWFMALLITIVMALVQQFDLNLDGPCDIEAAQDVAAEAATVAMVLP